MSEKKEYIVSGFSFQDKELSEKAKREVEGIKYVKSKTDMENPGMVLRVYNRIVEQQMFETPVGIGYLRELQEYLLTAPSVPREEILPIPVQELIEKDFHSMKKKSKRVSVSLVVSIILAVAIVGMIAISLTSRLPTVLNYEQEILNRYSSWEQELSEREQAVKLKEQELNLEP